MLQYKTPHGILVERTSTKSGYRRGLQFLLRDLDRHRGVYLSSGYEYPGRYSRWDIGSTRPPFELVARDRQVEFRPLNSRGDALLKMFEAVLQNHPHWADFGMDGRVLRGK